MKLAIAAEKNEVAQHFGRCPEYIIVDISSEGIVEEKTVLPNPGHEPGFLPGYLAQMGVNCIIAGGMGPRAQTLFAEQNIETIVGVTGQAEEIIKSYLSGNLVSGSSLCEHPEGHGHECGQ